MPKSAPRPMTRSGLEVARRALEIGQRALPRYAHVNSPQTFTQAQIFALLAVGQFFGLDYRGTAQLAKDWSDLRRALRLKRVPHFTTLQKAEQRLMEKGGSTGSLTKPLRKRTARD